MDRKQKQETIKVETEKQAGTCWCCGAPPKLGQDEYQQYYKGLTYRDSSTPPRDMDMYKEHMLSNGNSSKNKGNKAGEGNNYTSPGKESINNAPSENFNPQTGILKDSKVQTINKDENQAPMCSPPKRALSGGNKGQKEQCNKSDTEVKKNLHAVGPKGQAKYAEPHSENLSTLTSTSARTGAIMSNMGNKNVESDSSLGEKKNLDVKAGQNSGVLGISENGKCGNKNLPYGKECDSVQLAEEKNVPKSEAAGKKIVGVGNNTLVPEGNKLSEGKVGEMSNVEGQSETPQVQKSPM